MRLLLGLGAGLSLLLFADSARLAAREAAVAADSANSGSAWSAWWASREAGADVASSGPGVDSSRSAAKEPVEALASGRADSPRAPTEDLPITRDSTSRSATPTARALDAAVRAAFPGNAGDPFPIWTQRTVGGVPPEPRLDDYLPSRSGDGLAAEAPRALKGVAPSPTLVAEIGVIVSSLLVLGNVPPIAAAMFFLTFRSLRAKEPEGRRHAQIKLGVLIVVVVALVLVPVARRPDLVQATPWQWWLEYMSVRVAYRSGQPLPESQYLFAMVPHGLIPFSGACGTISKMVDVFFHMRIAVAPVSLKLPLLRNLMGWIGCISADLPSVKGALANGESVGLYPGGIAEMMRTDDASERLVLLTRKGFVRAAMEQGVPIVPVYIFGQSLASGHLQLPTWAEDLARSLRTALVLPYGRFGLPVPRKIPLLFAIGDPIPCKKSVTPTDDEVDEVHAAVVAAVEDLYDFYSGVYGWEDRPLSVE